MMSSSKKEDWQKMIEEWLKANKPSVRFTKEPMPHLEQKMDLKDG